MECYECTLEVANLNQLSKKDKNKFFMAYVGKPTKEVELEFQVIMSYISSCVKLYITSPPLEQNILWRLYDKVVKHYADPDRYEAEMNKI